MNMDAERKLGLPPVFNKDSKVLILGSFPSVKSRETEFYYGHKQNRFWKMLCGFFGEEVPKTTEGKRGFLLRKNVALWDMVVSCKIQGSSDASVKDAILADISEIVSKAKVEKILLNGSLAYQLFLQKYEGFPLPYVKMPSTSPANPRYSEKVWRKELFSVFAKETGNYDLQKNKRKNFSFRY